MKHILYETKDKDCPRNICDSNREVVLSLCKVCGGAEGAMPTNCPGRKITSDELDAIYAGNLNF